MIVSLANLNLKYNETVTAVPLEAFRKMLMSSFGNVQEFI